MLTDTALEALRPRGKPYKRADEKGLYVIVRPGGAIWWRSRYSVSGCEKLLSLGTDPDTSLRAARNRLDAARRLLAEGAHASIQRKVEKDATESTFESVAREWIRQQRMLRAGTVARLEHRLDRYALPPIGKQPIADITAVPDRKNNPYNRRLAQAMTR